MNLYTVKCITRSGEFHHTNLVMDAEKVTTTGIRNELVARYGPIKSYDDLSFVCTL